MGVIKRGNSKYWYIQFQMDGRTIIKSSRTTDKRLAEQLEVKIRNEMIRSYTLGIRDRIKLKDALSGFLKTKQHLACHKNYLLYSNQVMESIPGEIYLDQMTIRDIEKVRMTLITRNVTLQSIKNTLAFLKAMVKHAKSSGYQIPDVEFPSIKQSHGRLRYLTPEEEQRLLKSLEPTREIPGLPSYDQRSPIRQEAMQNQYDFVVALMDTGARRSEIATLEWRSIDFETRTIQLWRQKVRNQSILYMSDRLYEVMKRRFDNRDPNIPFVFHSKDGKPKPYCANTARRIFDRVGLHDCSYHTLRHTLASRLVQNGLSVYEVKEILGHTDIKTTMRYAHLERTQISLKAKHIIDALNKKANDAVIDTSKGV